MTSSAVRWVCDVAENPAGNRRTALVTGGSRGIGRSVAEQLLAAGHRVVITGRDEATLAATAAELTAAAANLTAGAATVDPVQTLAFDAADPAATAEALAGSVADIVVANIGVATSGTITSTTYDEWTRVLTTNVTSTFVVMQAVLPHMVEQGWGRVVTVGSLASHQGIRFGAAYATSKHALLGLTRAAAMDLAKTGVLVNMVSPALVRTDMTRDNIARMVAARGGTEAEAEARLARNTPEGRIIEPDEVARAIVALTTEDLTATGTVVAVGHQLADPPPVG